VVLTEPCAGDDSAGHALAAKRNVTTSKLSMQREQLFSTKQEKHSTIECNCGRPNAPMQVGAPSQPEAVHVIVAGPEICTRNTNEKCKTQTLT
jgi:hypothetical protein